MKVQIQFDIESRAKLNAKRKAKQNGMLFSEYSEKIYMNGMVFQDFCGQNNITPEDLFFYLESCTSATDIKKAVLQHA